MDSFYKLTRLLADSQLLLSLWMVSGKIELIKLMIARDFGPNIVSLSQSLLTLQSDVSFKVIRMLL